MTTNNERHFPIALIKIMNRFTLTVEMFAGTTGFPAETINDWLYARKVPDYHDLFQICAKLPVTPDDLFPKFQSLLDSLYE